MILVFLISLIKIMENKYEARIESSTDNNEVTILAVDMISIMTFNFRIVLSTFVKISANFKHRSTVD